MIYNLNVKNVPKLNEVGGKAKALIETKGAGFPVPDGIALSVEFFKPWLDKIKNSDEWQRLLQNTTKESCDLVKYKAAKMTFTTRQKKIFEASASGLAGKVFAVRSSSPEEDLEGTSFAGMYETSLGVLREGLEKEVAHAFSSCFDFRVMEYKFKNNIVLEGTSIAVIVQRQIAADVSGIGFSLNPLNNAFDEVFINASFGLGEAIVSGLVTPDSYIVDSVKDEIIDKKIGEKKIAIWLKSDGGIEKKENEKTEMQALSDKEIIEISVLIKECEAYYKKPIDIEWAFENGKLYLLQSRPITTYFPFFKELLTEPGKNKRFYIDIMAMTQGFDEPMSVLGLELWANMLDEIKMHMMTPQINGSVPIVYGKEYLSITAFQKLLGKKQSLAFINGYDGNLKKIFADINLDKHPFEGKVEGTKAFKKTFVKTVLRMIPGAIMGVFGDYSKGIRKYNGMADEIIKTTKEISDKGDFSKISRNALATMTRAMGTAPVIFSGMVSKRSLGKIFKGENVEKELSAMNMDLDGNPTSAMGQLIFAMACDKGFKDVSSKKNFLNKLKSRNFSDSFLVLYDEFMEKFSARGFKEIDVATKRIYEDTGMLYDKLIKINTEENQILEVKEKRQKAYDKLLLVAKRKGKEKKFIDAAARLKATFGYREHPKYLIVLIMAKLHNICLEMAYVWVHEGRLDKVYDVFDLKSDEIAKAQRDLSFDLRAAREKNLSGYLKINEWPLVIDSRGKIYKPALEIKDGDIIGDAIAPGKVKGFAKVLHTPYEKPIGSEEILVVRATEPSWTPIFTNAAGVVMEIGGPLQHGGIIAREYGIPCVSGLIGIMDIIEDGDFLEVDGSNGVLRILEKKKSTGIA